MKAAVLTKTNLLAPTKAGPASSRRRSSGSCAAAPVRAAAGSQLGTDLSAIFRDALSSPAVKKAAVPMPPTPASAPAAALSDAAAPAASVTVDPVPGTEILQNSSAPQLPPALTQGKDFVLDQLQSKAPDYGSGAASVAKATKVVAVPLTDSLATAGKGLGDGLASASKGLGDAGVAATKGLSTAADSFGDALGGAADALGGAASMLVGGASGATDAAVGASAAAAAAASQVASVLTGAAGGAAASAQQFLGAALDEFNTEASIIKANLDSLLGDVSSAVGGTTSALSSSVTSQAASVSSTVAGAADQLAGLLPPELQAALLAASDKVEEAMQRLLGLDPTTGGVVAGLALGLPALVAWNATYGGYAGTLDPKEALQVLQTQNAVLVDIRPEQQRLRCGVAELRRGARGKGAAVPPVQLLPSVVRRVRDSSTVALEIQALEVAALAKLSVGSTKVLVMDQQGEAGKRMARALRGVGVRRPYVVTGGFRAWREAGLGVKEGASEYDASPLDVVEDAAEAVVEQAASQLSGLRQPKNAAVLAAAVGGLGFLALNFHSSLQFLGVLGLELTLLNRAMSYSSMEDALDDLQVLYGNATSLAVLPAKAAEAVSRVGRSAAAAMQQAAGESKV